MALSDTKSIVPRANKEGTLGTGSKQWGQLHIYNPSDGGDYAASISNDDVDKFALYVAGANTTANVIDVACAALTTGSIFQANCTVTPAGGNENLGVIQLNIDFDSTGTCSARGIMVNLDKDQVTASGRTANVYGIQVDLDDAVTNVGTVNTYGVHVSNNFANTASGLL